MSNQRDSTSTWTRRRLQSLLVKIDLSVKNRSRNTQLKEDLLCPTIHSILLSSPHPPLPTSPLYLDLPPSHHFRLLCTCHPRLLKSTQSRFRPLQPLKMLTFLCLRLHLLYLLHPRIPSTLLLFRLDRTPRNRSEGI